MTLGCLNRHPACAGAVVMEFWIVPSYSTRFSPNKPIRGLLRDCRTSLGRLIYLVEYTTVAEMIRLCLLPAAEKRIVDGDQLDVGGLGQIRRRHQFGLGRAIVVLGDDRLAFLGIEPAEIGFGHLARALGIDIGVDDRHRWFGQA